MMPQKITINDINIPTSGRTSSDIIDEHTIRIVETIDIDSKDYIPEGDLNVEINIYEVFNLKDTFDFKFKYDKTAQDKKSISKTYDTKISLDDKTIIINKAYASPLSCSISFTSDYSNHTDINFIAVDNNGELLNFNKASDTLDKNYTNFIFYIVNKDMKQVSFIPYTGNNNNSNTGMNDKKIQPIDLNNNDSFIINATNDFGVIIKDLILDNDYLIVKYNNFILGKEIYIVGDTFTNLFLTENDSIVPFADDDSVKIFMKNITVIII